MFVVHYFFPTFVQSWAYESDTHLTYPLSPRLLTSSRHTSLDDEAASEGKDGEGMSRPKTSRELRGIVRAAKRAQYKTAQDRSSVLRVLNQGKAALAASLAKENDRLREQLRRLKRELEEEREAAADEREAAAEELARKDAELETNRDLWEDEMREKDEEVDDYQKRWKKTAKELNKLRASSQGFYQMTDQYLIDLATQLSYNIRSFAIQFFEGKIKVKGPIETSRFSGPYLHAIKPGGDKLHPGLKNYLVSPDRRPTVIQAFLWRVLVEEIMDGILWLGMEESIPFRKLNRLLRPVDEIAGSCGMLRPKPEAERKFQSWSAMTTNLLLGVCDTDKGSRADNDFQRHKASYLAKHITEVIGPFSRSTGSEYADQLDKILDDALKLDKEVSRQAARVVWTFNLESDIFDPETMEIENADAPLRKGEVLFAVAPSLVKRGKSTGEDFETENMLMKMTVACR